MIERYDTDYLAGHYQVDDDNVTILKDGELFRDLHILWKTIDSFWLIWMQMI